MKFIVGDRVQKVGGSYQATGIVRGAFLNKDGEERYNVDFDLIPGLLHIMSSGQLEYAVEFSEHSFEYWVEKQGGIKKAALNAYLHLVNRDDAVEEYRLALEEAALVVREYARLNPKQTVGGQEHDPCGAHAWLENARLLG